MSSRWFCTAVVLLWLTAMGWLVVRKVLPPLVVGEPPSYATILEAQRREPPVGWRMNFNGRPLGWALCDTSEGYNGVTEIRTYVHFDSLPLEAMAPPWLRTLLKYSGGPIPPVEVDVETTLSIDWTNRLERFESLLRLGSLQDAIIISGTIEGTDLHLVVSFGGERHEKTVYLPPNALVGDALAPQTQLPGLRLGQSWTVPVYSPLRPLSNPLEILQASVERKVSITWDGDTEQTLLVVYRRESGLTPGRNQPPRGRLWVRPGGTILKQEAMLLDRTMTFVRVSDEEAVELETNVKQRTDRWRD